jgi:hypothetical protein
MEREFPRSAKHGTERERQRSQWEQEARKDDTEGKQGQVVTRCTYNLKAR